MLPFPGELHAEVVAAVLLAAAGYVALGWRRGARALTAGSVAFFGGLLAVLVALNGPLHDLSDDHLFSAHMVQHLLLTLVAAPLLLAGTPGWMLDGVLGRLERWRLGPLARGLTRPLPAFTLAAVALVVWHLPGPYGAALASHRLHIVEHLVLLVTAGLGWWPVLSASARAPRLHYAAQILYLFALGLPMTVVAAMITGAEDVIYPGYGDAPRLFGLTPLEDQRLGGLIMWVPGGLIPLLAFTVVFFRWAATEADEPL